MFPEVWGAYHTQDDIRSQSSSGGVFSALAERVLAEGGSVFGAAMVYSESGLTCRHTECRTREELGRLRGSKYTVSELGTIFFSVKERLEQGNRVMFCGTPCQVAALSSFLGKRHSNLLSVDFVCHGVPVPYVLEKFLREQELQDRKKTVDMLFRDKTEGWENYSVRTVTEDGGGHRWVLPKSQYMQLYLSDQFLRPSCYDCRQRGDARCSDITLGDFWGVRNYLDVEPEEIRKGISVVVVHSEAGKAFLDQAAAALTVIPADMEYFKRSNIPYSRSVQKPVDNILFRRVLTRWPIARILRTHERLKSLRRIRNRIVRKIRRLWQPENRCRCGTVRLPGTDGCCGCRNCENSCPVGAIEMRADTFGVLHPVIQEETCIHCGRCLRVCPRLEKKRSKA